MAIKQIKEIHNIKNFINFSCNDEFCYFKKVQSTTISKKSLKDKNLLNDKQQLFTAEQVKQPADVIIYAPNGSGKTSFSRVLECWDYKNKIFDPNKINNIKSIEFDGIMEMPKIEFFDNNLENKILVYNHDFIDRNVLKNFSSGKNKGGFLNIGTESRCIELEKKLKNVKKYYLFCNFLKNKKDKKLRAELEVRQKFIRRKFNLRSDGCFIFENLTHNFIMSKEEFDIEKDYFSELAQLKSINIENTINIPVFDKVFLDVDLLNTIFCNEEKFADEEKEIEEYIIKINRDWIEKGLEKLSLVDGKCPFCQANINNDLMGMILYLVIFHYLVLLLLLIYCFYLPHLQQHYLYFH